MKGNALSEYPATSRDGKTTLQSLGARRASSLSHQGGRWCAGCRPTCHSLGHPKWCVTIRNLIKYRSFQANIQEVFPGAQERVATRGELFLRQRTSPGDPQSVPHNTAGLIRRVATSNIRLLPKPWQSFLDWTNDDIAFEDEIRISEESCLHAINVMEIGPLPKAKWRESVVTLNLKLFFVTWK